MFLQRPDSGSGCCSGLEGTFSVPTVSEAYCIKPEDSCSVNPIDEDKCFADKFIEHTVKLERDFCPLINSITTKSGADDGLFIRSMCLRSHRKCQISTVTGSALEDGKIFNSPLKVENSTNEAGNFVSLSRSSSVAFGSEGSPGYSLRPRKPNF